MSHTQTFLQTTGLIPGVESMPLENVISHLLSLSQTIVSLDKKQPGFFNRILASLQADGYGNDPQVQFLLTLLFYHQAVNAKVQDGDVLWSTLGDAFEQVQATPARLGFLGPNYAGLCWRRAKADPETMFRVYALTFARAKALPEGEREESIGFAAYNRANYLNGALDMNAENIQTILGHWKTAADNRIAFAQWLELQHAPEAQVFAAWQQVAKLWLTFAKVPRFQGLDQEQCGVPKNVYLSLVEGKYKDRVDEFLNFVA